MYMCVSSSLETQMFLRLVQVATGGGFNGRVLHHEHMLIRAIKNPSGNVTQLFLFSSYCIAFQSVFSLHHIQIQTLYRFNH